MTNDSFEQAATRIVNGSADPTDKWLFTQEYNQRTAPNPYGDLTPPQPVPPICEKAAKLLDLRPGQPIQA